MVNALRQTKIFLSENCSLFQTCATNLSDLTSFRHDLFAIEMQEGGFKDFEKRSFIRESNPSIRALK